MVEMSAQMQQQIHTMSAKKDLTGDSHSKQLLRSREEKQRDNKKETETINEMFILPYI
jgi:hypothetical protein